MADENSPYPIGKLPAEVMKNLLSKFHSPPESSGVVIGPTQGQDTGIVSFGGQDLVFKANPVTFATDEIGYYGVILNANDIAASGAIPRWFTATILLPEGKTTPGLCDAIFASIAEECHKRSIAVVAGHTEITLGLNRPILAGTMVGTIPPNKNRISTFGGKRGDALLLIKDVAIEGTAIIAREKGQFLLEQGLSPTEIEEAKQYLYRPGISSVQESLFLTDTFDIDALHGPTEGGIKAGIAELAQNSHCGAKIYIDQIQIPALTQKLCKLFEIDPLGLISSGCLLVAVDPPLAPKIIAECKARRLVVQQIGLLTSDEGNLVFEHKNGTQTKFTHSHQDEITKIFW